MWHKQVKFAYVTVRGTQGVLSESCFGNLTVNFTFAEGKLLCVNKHILKAKMAPSPSDHPFQAQFTEAQFPDSK